MRKDGKYPLPDDYMEITFYPFDTNKSFSHKTHKLSFIFVLDFLVFPTQPRTERM